MTRPTLPPAARSTWPRRAFSVLGVLLLFAWAAWWLLNLARDRCVGATLIWVPAWRYLGLDFLHNYLAVRHILRGGNPYTQFFGDERGAYAYPPLVLGLFSWCGLLSHPYRAAVLWTGAIVALLVVGTWAAWRFRRARRLAYVPLPLALALVLLSTPAVFEMERGNCDVIVLGMILLAATCLRRKTARFDWLAGICLAVAMWTKVYPGLVVLAAPALGRWRVFMAAVVAGLLIGLVPWPATLTFFRTASSSEGYRTKFISSAATLSRDPDKAEAGAQLYPPLEAFSHSLPIYWRHFWADQARLPIIGRIPGMLGTAVVLGPGLLWMFLRVRAAPDPTAVAYPYLLWVALAATFWMPVSYDYNLIYLPILAVAVLDFRDGPLVLAMMTPVMFYLQPFKQQAPMELILAFKLLALYALAVCVARRAKVLAPGT